MATEERSYCQDCFKEYDAKEIILLERVGHLYERVAPGEPFPSGECPECGALTQLISVREQVDREAWFRKQAIENHYDEGYLEIDDNAIVSQAEDEEAAAEGAYVQAWIWIQAPEGGDFSEQDDCERAA